MTNEFLGIKECQNVTKYFESYFGTGGTLTELERVLTSFSGIQTEQILSFFPNHGSEELGKGLQRKILKQAGIKL